MAEGNLRKMRVSLDDQVQYRLMLSEELNMNDFIGKEINLEWNGVINCTNCGKKTKSSNVLKSIEVIKYSKDTFDSLYNNISEFVFNEDSEYEIILKNGRTKILLGSNNIFAKIDYLNAFANVLPEEKTLESYRYIDLRYKRQIVVDEI